MSDSILLPKGQKMPDTREAFEYHAELAEKAMLRDQETIAKLKERINKLEQKLSKMRKPI